MEQIEDNNVANDTTKTKNDFIINIKKIMNKDKKRTGCILCIVASVFLLIAVARVTNDEYSFYKQHYKECMEGYRESVLDVENSTAMFRGTYKFIASSYKEMAEKANIRLWKYRIEAIIFVLGACASGAIGYKYILVEKGKNNGVN